MNSVGIVVALASEARALTSHKLVPGEITEITPGVRAVLCGIGPDAAERAARMLVDSGVAALAVFGVAGALSEQLKPGDLICPATVLNESGARYATDAAWRSRIAAGSGATLLSVSKVLATPQDKANARERFSAQAVDMESAAVAEIAQKRKLPFLVLRAIADDASTSLPPAVSAGVDTYGHPRPMALLSGLLRNPSAVFALPRLATSMNSALAALSTVVGKSGSDLGYKT